MPTLKIIRLSTLWLEIFHCVPFKLQKQMSASKEKCKHVTTFHFKTSLDHQVQPRSGGGWGWHGTQPLTTAQGTRRWPRLLTQTPENWGRVGGFLMEDR